AEHVAHDRRVAPVIDRTSPQQRLARAEPRLDHPQPLVLEGHLGGIQLGVSPQHPLAVVAGILRDLGLVDPEAAGPGLAPSLPSPPPGPARPVRALPPAGARATAAAAASWTRPDLGV